MATQQFQTEVSQLLQLIVHSLYSHPEIFLRELISNSSDALDRLRYLTLTDEKYKTLVDNGIESPRIDLELDEAIKTLTISDTGIGMNEEELASHLGTIARSGTKSFLVQLSGDARRDSNLIGQFGVGFYSVFMVADQVEVISRKAGEEKTYKWTSDGQTGFDLEEVVGAGARKNAGTSVLIHFNDEGAQYANGRRLQEIVKKYSNHIAFPIFLTYEKSEWNGEKKEPTKTRTVEQVNAASAMWQRTKSELKDEDYKGFYKSISGGWDDPICWFHTRAEGALEYTTLFYIPAKAPGDLYNPDSKGSIKLYVKRVFIMDDSRELLPPYLRFVRGIIDSEDLPLNVSREILQQNKVLTSIKTASVRKILSELKTIATGDPQKYSQFVAEYNRHLKEGLYGDWANHETLLELIRFKSTKVDGLTSLAEAKGRMQPDQKALYYIIGSSEGALRNSPLLEIFKNKDIEVLILDDDIDEIVFSNVYKYGDIDLKTVNKAASDIFEEDSTQQKAEELKPLMEKIKTTLGEAVNDVRASSRLVSSPSVIISEEDEPSARSLNMMRTMGQKVVPQPAPTLEINPDHEIIRKLLADPCNTRVEDAAWLLFEQAQLLQGLPLKDAASFVQRINRALNQSI